MKTTRSSNILEPIANRNFGNIFHHNNGNNQFQYVHKHTGQQYQCRPLQISKNFSPPYIKENLLYVKFTTRK